jgi:uncharacterized membrane protein
MNVDVLTRIEIGRSRSSVYSYAADPDNAPRWYINIDSVEWETPPPLRVGSRVAFVAHFLGRRLSYTYEVVELIEDEVLVMRTANGPFPMQTTYTFQAQGPERTVMTLRNSGRAAGFSVLAAPFLSLAMRRQNRRDLALLKEILERRRNGAAS